MISVSVIIPIFNKEQYISECLDSVLSQTLRDTEVICVDDGSTDNSAEIVESYIKEHENVLLIRKENTGVGETRNVGIMKAMGKYLCFMDPDDYYPDNKVLETLYDLAELNRVKICGGSFSSIKDGNIVTDYPYPNNGYRFSEEGVISYSDYQFDYGFQRFIFSRQMILENDIKFPNYIRFQDPPFFVSCMVSAGSFYAITMETYRYREAYKKMEWNLSKKIDNLYGMLDVIKIADKNGLDELKERMYARITSNYYRNIITRNESRYEFAVISGILGKIGNYIDGQSTRKGKFSDMYEDVDRKARKKAEVPPAISIVIPVYNVEKYIGECLESVIHQDFGGIEVICVDDGTQDNSANICERYAETDIRITVIHRFNGGLSRARNTGADFADGEFLYFLDSDDMLKQGALSRIYEVMSTNELDALFFDAETILESETSKKHEKEFKNTYSERMESTEVMRGVTLLSKMIDKNAYRSPVQLSAVKKEFYDSENMKCYPGIVHEDNLYTWEVFLLANRAKYIAEELYIRRIRKDSIMTSEKSFKNFYGYLKCYTEMNNTIKNSDNKDIIRPASIIKDRNKRSAKVVFEYLSYTERNRINYLGIRDREMMAQDPPFDIPIEWKCVPLVTLVTISKKIKQYDALQSVWDAKQVFVEGDIDVNNFKILSKKIEDTINDIKSKYIILVNQKIQSKNFIKDVLSYSIGSQSSRFQFMSNDGTPAIIVIKEVVDSELMDADFNIKDQENQKTDLLLPLHWLRNNVSRVIQRLRR